MKQYHDRPGDAEEDVELQPVFQPSESGEKLVSLACNVAKDPNNNQECTDYTQAVPKGSTRFKPIVLRVVEALLQARRVIGNAGNKEKDGQTNDNGNQCADVNLMGPG